VRLRFTPAEIGDNPFTAQVVQLRPYLAWDSEPTREIVARILNDPMAFAQLRDQVLAGRPDRSELLLFIDQFEELFTLAKPEYVSPFLEWLCAAARSDRVRIVATIRADFYHLLVTNAPLAVLLRKAHYSLAAPGAKDLLAMVTLPAQGAGLLFEKGLVNRILRDTGTEPGGLALLAFALAELYRLRQGDLLTNAAYDRFRGVKGAIASRASDSLKNLSREEQESLDRIFIGLVGIDERGVVTRRAARKRPLVEAIPCGERLLDLLTNRARLLVATERSDGEPVVEIAHESLFETWDRLSKWVNDRKGDLVLLRQMKNAAEEWDRHRCANAYLWPHERLSPLPGAIERLGSELSDLSPVHHAFMRAEADRLLDEINKATTSHDRRAAIGIRLAQIGDSRSGITDVTGRSGIAWCVVGPGRVRLHPGLREFDVAAFRIAKYPVTWAQYETFMSENETAARIIRPVRQEQIFPVTGLTWFDAVRFCRWLSSRYGFEIRLPTEWEWQLAATGGAVDRDYPWGSECNLERANSFESRLRQVTAVGMYPDGASAIGAMDMAGNVWEWCSNTYDTLQLDVSSTDRVVIRGGSWRNNLTVARTWYRNHVDPTRGQDCVGFRVVTSYIPGG
jgi:hypothetical protein